MARICLIREWYFPVDERVNREVDALVRAGHEVDIVCATMPGQPRFERIGSVSVHRLPLTRRRAGLLRYVFEWASFQVVATVFVAALHLRRRYQVVQANTLPDWLVFAAIVPKLLGARVLLDLHECMPEYAATMYRLPLRHPVIRLLKAVERASIAFADGVVTCTDQMRERFMERGAPGEKIAVALNSCDEERLDPGRYSSQARRADGRFVLVCHGTVDRNFGIDLVVRAVALLKDRVPALRLEIYGEGRQRLELEALARDLGVEDRVWFSRRFLSMSELLPHIADADVGVVAIRRDAFRDLTHCNKMYELIAMRKPVIISRTRAVEAYFGDDCFQLFESDNEHDLARAILEMHADPDRRERLVERASSRAEPYRWIHQRERYLGAVGRLLPHAPAEDRPDLVVPEPVPAVEAVVEG
ncbi:MAG TPA: glycosyltransferase family 4 protein [Candidatus Limnocylindria bacterium]|nr:glycosyltransferase family 4 protein [Candidatus Limnocylindria bacterium]